jgi:hypothetical protein
MQDAFPLSMWVMVGEISRTGIFQKRHGGLGRKKRVPGAASQGDWPRL